MPAPRMRRAPRGGGAVMYVGPQRPGVTVAATGTFCAFGVPVDLPAELAERLLQQPSWAPADPPGPAEPSVTEHEEQ